MFAVPMTAEFYEISKDQERAGGRVKLCIRSVSVKFVSNVRSVTFKYSTSPSPLCRSRLQRVLILSTIRMLPQVNIEIIFDGKVKIARSKINHSEH